MNQIHDKAMLVTLTISQWSARKFDRKVSDEVATNHSASKDAGRYNKALISKKALEKITSAVSKLRTFHYEQTLPWGDSGSRVLLAKNYFDYMNQLSQLKSEFDQAVSDFIPNYMNYVAEAQRRLNGMFNPDDYPPLSQIGSKFAIKVNVTPVPKGDDFRIDLGDEEVSRIKDDIEKRMAQAQQEAMKDVWQRLYDVINKMSTRLSDPDAKFRNSLVENVTSLVGLLPKLNLTDDPNLDKFRRDIETQICNLHPETLRMNKTKRKEAVAKTNEIMKNMEAFMGAGSV